MTAGEMLSALMDYFAQGKYPDAVVNRMRFTIESIGDAERQVVLDHLIETQKASFKISVAEIVEACKALGIGYHESKFIPATDWTCDACGHEFKYVQAVTDDDKIDRNLHDVCPMCGFQPGWTIQRAAYEQAGNLTPEYAAWYDRMLEHMPAKHGPKAPEGIYWARSKAEAERREAQRKPIPYGLLRRPRVNEGRAS